MLPFPVHHQAVLTYCAMSLCDNSEANRAGLFLLKHVENIFCQTKPKKIIKSKKKLQS